MTDKQWRSILDREFPGLDWHRQKNTEARKFAARCWGNEFHAVLKPYELLFSVNNEVLCTMPLNTPVPDLLFARIFATFASAALRKHNRELQVKVDRLEWALTPRIRT